MVIEFSTSRNKLYDNKLNRFTQLKIGYFNQNLSDAEELELSEIENWLKIHK